MGVFIASHILRPVCTLSFYWRVEGVAIPGRKPRLPTFDPLSDRQTAVNGKVGACYVVSLRGSEKDNCCGDFLD